MSAYRLAALQADVPIGKPLLPRAGPSTVRAARFGYARTAPLNEWRSVLGQDPGNIEARLGLACAAAKAGDRAAAAQEYLRILQIVPDQPEARRELARLGRAAGS